MSCRRGRARRGAGRDLVGGDYGLVGAWPEGTLARLDGLDAVLLRRNGKRCARAARRSAQNRSSRSPPSDPLSEWAETVSRRLGRAELVLTPPRSGRRD
jgi:hypothetical protein